MALSEDKYEELFKFVTNRRNLYVQAIECPHKEAHEVAEEDAASEYGITTDEVRAIYIAYWHKNGKKIVSERIKEDYQKKPSAPEPVKVFLPPVQAEVPEPKRRRGKTESNKNLTALYESWVVENDIVPHDKALSHFMNVSRSNPSRVRVSLAEKGYEFKREEGGWRVTKRPKGTTIEKGELESLKSLIKRLRDDGVDI